MDEGCVAIDSIRVTLPIELLYWDDETILGLPPDIDFHVPVLEKAISSLKRVGYSIIACMCGGLNENKNMYILFTGCIRFNTLPQGFDTYGVLSQEGKEFTLLHPVDYDPNITPSEMQDYLNAKTSVLRKWARGGAK
jgi:hypothetical protein